MVEGNCVPPAFWEGEKKNSFPTLTHVLSCHENPHSLKKEKLILCIKTAYSTTNSITQTCSCVFSALKRQERRDKQGYRDIQHLTLFCLGYLWYGGQCSDWKHITSHLTSPSIPWCLFWAFKVSQYSTLWFQQFWMNNNQLRSRWGTCKKWQGEKSLRDALSIQQPSVS